MQQPLIESELTPEQMRARARATAYRHAITYGRIHLLSVWAMFYKARDAGADTPKLDLVFGYLSEKQFIWQNTRTDEIVVNHLPYMRGTWKLLKETEFDSGSSSTKRALTPVQIIGLSVSIVLRRKLGDDEIAELVSYLPLAGPYEGDYWLPIQGEVTSLRNIDRPDHNDNESGLTFEQKLEHVKKFRVVKRALRAIEGKAPVAPKEARPQLKLGA